MIHRIFYHSADLDGICSAAIAKKYMLENDLSYKLYPINYGEHFPIEEILKEDKIYFLDFSLQPAQKMIDLQNDGYELIVCDHHKSTLEEFEILDYFPSGKYGLLNAGCELTWSYFYPNESLPPVVHLLGRYDVWDKTNPDTNPFQYYMRACNYDIENDFHIWCDYLNAIMSISDKVETGKIILKYQKSVYANIIKDLSYTKNWENLKCLIVNASGNSQTFDSRFNEIDYDVMVLYKHVKGEYFTVSIYTTKKDVDCSAIAKKYFGGGHMQAAGFQCKYLPWID